MSAPALILDRPATTIAVPAKLRAHIRMLMANGMRINDIADSAQIDSAVVYAVLGANPRGIRPLHARALWTVRLRPIQAHAPARNPAGVARQPRRARAGDCKRLSLPDTVPSASPAHWRSQQPRSPPSSSPIETTSHSRSPNPSPTYSTNCRWCAEKINPQNNWAKPIVGHAPSTGTRTALTAPTPIPVGLTATTAPTNWQSYGPNASAP